MKQMEGEGGGGKPENANPPLPPPPPPLPRFRGKKEMTVSVTNQEIAKYWRQRRMEEEDHLLAAIKAAARIRAQNLPADDYRRFMESLEEDSNKSEENHESSSKKDDENNKELRVGIKDWWTKSKYAYLNQPTIDAMDGSKCRTSTYIPNFCNFRPTLPPISTTFGIF